MATDGGGIQNESGTLALNSVTIAENSATGMGGGIDFTGQLNIENTIVAANTGPAPGNGPDIRKGVSTFVVTGANLIGNNDTAESNFAAAPPLVGTTASPVAPSLGTLGDYGGDLPTMALRGSPAIDAGIVTFNTPVTDQRGSGFFRFRGATIDIGAYETGNGEGYAIWALENIVPMADTSYDGDAEWDGNRNGNEYAFRLNPIVSDNSLHPAPVLVDNGGSLEMRVTFPFRPEATDLIYLVERSSDLENFSEIYRYDSSTGMETITSPPAVDATVDGGAMEIEVVDTDTTGPRTFWRLRTELIVP